MTKVEKVSIGGIAFVLDEEAYGILDSYLGELRDYYGDRDGGREIMDDIEERLAELITEKSRGSEVVSVKIVNEVISILGDAGTLTGDGNASEETSRRCKKRLYRNTDNKILGGVLSGIAAWFGIDEIMIRAPFLILCIAMFFSDFSHDWLNWVFPIAYLVLWICMPKAATYEQKAQMRGESGSIRDIGKNSRRSRANSAGGKYVGHACRGGNNGGQDRTVARTVFRVLAVVCGIFFMIAGICGAAVIFSAVVLGVKIGWSAFSGDVMDFIWLGGMNTMVLKSLVLLVAGIPAILLIYLSLALLFGVKKRWFAVSMLVLWLVSVSALAVSAVSIAGRYSHRSVHDTEFQDARLQSDTLYIDFKSENGWDVEKYIEATRWQYDMACIDKAGKSVMVYPEIRIVRTDGDSTYIRYEKHSVSASEADAIYKSRMQDFNMEISEGGITVSPDVYTADSKYRFERDRIFIYLASGAEVAVRSPVYYGFSSDETITIPDSYWLLKAL